MRAKGANGVSGSGERMRHQMDMLMHLAWCNLLLSLLFFSNTLFANECTQQIISFLKCRDGIYERSARVDGWSSAAIWSGLWLRPAWSVCDPLQLQWLEIFTSSKDQQMGWNLVIKRDSTTNQLKWIHSNNLQTVIIIITGAAYLKPLKTFGNTSTFGPHIKFNMCVYVCWHCCFHSVWYMTVCQQLIKAILWIMIFPDVLLL